MSVTPDEYWILHENILKITPNKMGFFKELKATQKLVNEKGRKKDVQIRNLLSGEMVKNERLLDQNEFKSFIEVSIRAAKCPLPLNVDAWDGLKCPYRCRYCVSPKQKILMADGTTKVIERIYEGDRVLSFNENSLSYEPSTVTETMKRQEKELIEIELQDRTLKVTKEHPIFTKRGWVNAGDLTENDEVMVW